MMNNWAEHLEPLIKKYEKRKHPLDYANRYQLLVMVILSAQDSDKHINELSSSFFKTFPSITELKTALPEDIYPLIGSVRNFNNKSKWLVALAQLVSDDSKIPTTLDELIKLPGIGRKSANVIIRESGGHAEGVIVDLHVLRVAPRLGIAVGDKPEKIEKQLMEVMPKEEWNEVGMALSFLGREICRPTNPKCDQCMLNSICNYYKDGLKKMA
jgi:endonuclease III